MICTDCIFYFDSGGCLGFQDECGHDPHPANISDLFDTEDTTCEYFEKRPTDWGLIMSKAEWTRKYKKETKKIMDGKITITKKEYLRLQIESERLNRLEFGGVDNWDWYDASMNPDDRPDMEDFEEMEKVRIKAL